MFLDIELKFNQFRPMDTNTFDTILQAQLDLLLGEQRYAKITTKFIIFTLCKQTVLLIKIA